jgi:hypothetical protein
MNRIYILLSAFLTVACSESQPLIIKKEEVKIQIEHPADPVGVRMLPVKYRVLTRENLDEFLTEIEKTQGKNPVFIGILFSDYENITLNLGDLKRYIEQQKSIIVYYRNISANTN